jgi:hypothetical protein
MYNLISSPYIQLNARFDYLATGKCDYDNTACWSHPGTYLGELGFYFKGNNKVRIISGSHQQGLSLFVNERKVNADTTQGISIHTEDY